MLACHTRRLTERFFVAAAALILNYEPLFAAPGCSAKTSCLDVNDNGSPSAGPGPDIAQCSGRFPDFIFPSNLIPADYSGPWFRLSQEFPTSADQNDAPWLKIDFRNNGDSAAKYLLSLRDYAFEGMLDVEFKPADNKIRNWYHMPLMNFGQNRREPSHGLTGERSVKGPELGLKTGVVIHDYAVGFYNAMAAISIGQVWASNVPDLTKAHFSNGSMAFKILFSDASADNYQDITSYPLQGAPEWTILTADGKKTVRIMQMDVATADERSPTGWVFGTFAFDRNWADGSPWTKLRPVGLSWGNDPLFTPSDQAADHKLLETSISDQAPGYALKHLGWAGRANGPVDNPISGCLSCHGTAQFPVAAPIAPFSPKCDSDTKKLYWFRDLKGSDVFGAVDPASCSPIAPAVPIAALDFSLQFQVSIQSTLQFKDVNPCTPSPASPQVTDRTLSLSLGPYANAPRVTRGQSE